jgi:Galactose oxidase, central domain
MRSGWIAIVAVALTACGTIAQQPLTSPVAQGNTSSPAATGPLFIPSETVASPGPAAPPPMGRWETLPRMSVPRIAFTATLLRDGRVLIAGGRTQRFADSSDGTPTTSVDIFDPATRRFLPAASLGTARAGHTATLLPSGQVLVAGGDPRGTAEIYDPAFDTWTLTSPMHDRRYDHAAALLPGGRVLVTGGAPSPPVGISARGAAPATLPSEIYDPAAGTWTVAATPAFDRPEYPTATVLKDGRVLVVGGQYMYNSPDESRETSEIYDSQSNTWSPTAIETRAGARQYHTATRLPSGEVLVAGGIQDSHTNAWAVLYNPISDSWTQVPNMTVARCGQGAQLLATGKVLLFGSGCWSDMSATAEEFDPVSYRWFPVASLAGPRGDIVPVGLTDGEVLALGGGMPVNTPTWTAEIFQPA